MERLDLMRSIKINRSNLFRATRMILSDKQLLRKNRPSNSFIQCSKRLLKTQFRPKAARLQPNDNYSLWIRITIHKNSYFWIMRSEKPRLLTVNCALPKGANLSIINGPLSLTAVEDAFFLLASLFWTSESKERKMALLLNETTFFQS